ncbi:MAG: CDP-glycerol glycerophosphotransferase family protein, partial [Streptococcaceae bacterium]|nr:CDP-glycerol glycerophosphotransferase family protein [Streptococcaceae bacterium]
MASPLNKLLSILPISTNTSTQLNAFYAKALDTLSIEQNTILYETRDGSSMVDSPYAIFKELILDPRFAGWTHLWVVKPGKESLLDYLSQVERKQVTLGLRDTK